MTAEASTASRPTQKGTSLGREVNSLLIAVIIGITTYIFAHWAVPQIPSQGLHELLKKFVGVSWPFFVTVMVYLYYVTGAWIVETFALVSGRRRTATHSSAVVVTTGAETLAGIQPFADMFLGQQQAFFIDRYFSSA